jgi:exopolysaccharide biosynthesis polyprenyl glycosylphosphotransferase
MLVLAAAVTVLGGDAAGAASPSLPAIAAFTLVALALYASNGLYRLRFRLRMLDDVRTVVVATTIAAMVVLTALVIFSSDGNVAPETVRLWAFAVAYVSAGRVALYWSQRRSREDGDGLRSTLIVGAGRIGTLVARRLLEAPALGLRPVAFFDADPLVDTATELGVPVVGPALDIEEAVDRHRVEQVIVTFSNAPDDVLLDLVRRCEALGVPTSVVPRLFERMPEMSSLEHLGGVPLISPRPADPRAWQFRIKYSLDRVLAAGAILLCSPLYAAVALAVWITMGRPIFFRQTRVGIDGRRFEMLKFRSMREAKESDEFLPPNGLAPGGVEGVDRRTRLGCFLRATSIDELPQLINVVRGDMSIVGPRPERPEFVEDFAESVYRYVDRLRVKSGITGWAQVHGLRGRTSLADRAEWDNYYIENFSLWLDLKIMVMTVGTLFGRRAE